MDKRHRNPRRRNQEEPVKVPPPTLICFLSSDLIIILSVSVFPPGQPEGRSTVSRRLLLYFQVLCRGNRPLVTMVVTWAVGFGGRTSPLLRWKACRPESEVRSGHLTEIIRSEHTLKKEILGFRLDSISASLLTAQVLWQ